MHCFFNFKDWFFLGENTESLVSGPAIRRLQDTFHSMMRRGAPVEDDLTGFNKTDWNFYHSNLQYMNAEQIPIPVVKRMLNVLNKYKNTQLPEYEDLKAEVEAEINKATGLTSRGSKVLVFDKTPLDNFQKLKVYIPNPSMGRTRAINQILDLALEDESRTNPRIVQTQDKFGKWNWPRYRKMSNESSEVDTFRIHPSVLNQILDLLRSKYKMEVEFESGASSYATAPRPTEKLQGDIEIIGEEQTNFGKKLAIKFLIPLDRNQRIYNDLKSKNLVPSMISYGGSGKFLIDIENPNSFARIKQEFADAGLDITSLENFQPKEQEKSEKPPEQPAARNVQKEKLIDFTDLPENAMQVKIDYRKSPSDQKEFLKECVQFCFPDYSFNQLNFSYIVKGDFNQYVTFGKLLSEKGYNVDELRQILRQKLDLGKVKKTDLQGIYDKDEKFLSSIDGSLPESKFDLYDQQKQGIAFLYGRNQAILGDETGLGKTVQLISAAELKMQSTNKPTLIVTLKGTQQQWVEEIKNVVGEEVSSEISTNGLNPKRWTVVYYDNFSSGKNLESIVETLSNAGFGIIIFDELHKVKHGTSKRSMNLAKVVSNIPVRWGATATISSNKPMDVRNQLMILGHYLGDVSQGKFKRDFAGMKPTGYGGAYELGSEEDQIKAAERLNKWLNLSGVYVRRSKSDIRDMPNLEIKDDTVGIDESLFTSLYANRLSSYKNPNLAVSKLIAAREVIANLKSNETTRKALNIVRSAKGKNSAAGKIVVFTNFVESANNLVKKIQDGLKTIDPNYYALTYLANTKKRDRNEVKNRFTNDPNAKILIMSMRMGGTGIDFPNAAQNMLINDFDWTPESAEQSEGRIYRINTNHSVNIEYVVSSGIDRGLFDRVQKKRKIATIIQKYRKDYQESDNDETILKKIVDAQRELRDIDKQMIDLIAKELPGAEEAFD